MFPCIYRITNLVNNKVYIGQTEDLDRRKNEHKNKPTNLHISNSIKKYGWEVFFFKIIEEPKKDHLNEREVFWISHYSSTNKHKGYNKSNGANSITEETKKKISNTLKGHKKTQEEISKRVKTRLKNGNYQSKEAIDKMRETHLSKGISWWTNGKTDIQVPINSVPPKGFIKGRKNKGKRINRKGKHEWWTNGNTNKLVKVGDPTPDGFWKGSNQKHSYY